jgi:diguanylate cyclase (GGDEF)-like protein
LTGGRVLVGRDPLAQLSIEDESVSRRHALIESTPEGDNVQDLESTNGIWVNEQRVLAKRLEPGDRVRFGNQIFTYLSASSIEAQYHESVYKMMTTDGLTQVHNKRFLLESLERELVRVRRRRSPLCVLMMDIDHFKSVNDRYGHLAGDAVLVEFSRRVASVLEGDELLARYGGEEFTLVMADTVSEEAVQIAEKIRAAVSNGPVCFDGDQIALTVSIGVAQFPAEADCDASALLESADQMLYLAKSSGRNQVQCRRS